MLFPIIKTLEEEIKTDKFQKFELCISIFKPAGSNLLVNESF